MRRRGKRANIYDPTSNCIGRATFPLRPGASGPSQRIPRGHKAHVPRGASSCPHATDGSRSGLRQPEDSERAMNRMNMPSDLGLVERTRALQPLIAQKADRGRTEAASHPTGGVRPDREQALPLSLLPRRFAAVLHTPRSIAHRCIVLQTAPNITPTRHGRIEPPSGDGGPIALSLGKASGSVIR